MKPIDELIGLSSEELKLLEAKRLTSNTGCAIFALILGGLAAAALILGFGKAAVLASAGLALLALLFIALGAYMLKIGPSENKNVAKDIAEGRKRRIVAPIERKDIVRVRQRGDIVPDSVGSSHLPAETVVAEMAALSLKQDASKTPAAGGEEHPWIGKNIKDIAPIKSDKFLNHEKYEDYLERANPWMGYTSRQSRHDHGTLVYTFTAQDYTFTITPGDYASGFGKGDFVEFTFCPNSKLFITLPEEVRE